MMRRPLAPGLAALGVLTLSTGLLAQSAPPIEQEPAGAAAIASAAVAARGSAGVARVRSADAAAMASARPAGELELVATFPDAMPTGVTVSARGRIFVNFPRWGDPVPFTVGEVREDGSVVPYPSIDLNTLDTTRPLDTLVSVQSVVVDPQDRLWLLDTGSLELGPVIEGGPKLVGVDLATNHPFIFIRFPKDVVLKTTYLNDIRFDLRRGEGGVAFITDSSKDGPNGVIVVDLHTGESWRRLSDHPSTKAEAGFVPFVEGRALLEFPPGERPRPLRIGSDGLALNQDGGRLFYTALASRHLWSVDASALADQRLGDGDVATTIRDEGMIPAADGLEADAQGRLYVTAWEQNAIVRRAPGREFQTLVHDPRLLWPDTLCLANDQHLYVIANQLHRQRAYDPEGEDRRQRPYALFRVRVDADPVRLVGAEKSK
jgi:sugar lactone lactonase YvrE